MIALRRWAKHLAVPGVLLELGVGRSALDNLPELQSPATLHVGVDRSALMLRHSLGLGIDGVVADSRRLPIDSEAVDGAFASLGDPYNGFELWREVRRTLRIGAYFAFTSPAEEWSDAYRTTEGSPGDVALFMSRDGQMHPVPSRVLSPRDQATMIANAGLSLIDCATVTRSLPA